MKKRGGRQIRSFLTKLFLCLSTFAAGLGLIPLSADARKGVSPANGTPEITLSVRVSPDAPYSTDLHIRSKRWIRSMRKLKAAGPGQEVSSSDVTVTLNDGSLQKVYLLSDDGTLTDVPGSGHWSPPGRLKKDLTRAAKRLRESHYGKLVSWTLADRMFPRKAVATITDLETGLTFRGQRRAGSSHADVQPLTKQDTAIMKEIYGGRWSWNRRAVLVSTPEGRLAASMHGMPHGGDGIPDNDFKGHFCIHFAGSTTHGSGQSDLAHQVMVQKAAGQLGTYLATLSPSDLTDAFLVAANLKDRHFMNLLVKDGPAKESTLTEWLDSGLKGVRRVSETEEALPGDETLETELRVRMSIWRDGCSPYGEWFAFRLRRSSPEAGWKIDGVDAKNKRSACVSASHVLDIFTEGSTFRPDASIRAR